MEAALSGAQAMRGHYRNRLRPTLGQQNRNVGAGRQPHVGGDRAAAPDEDGRTATAFNDMAGRDPEAVAGDREGGAGGRLEGNVGRVDGDGGIERRDRAQQGALHFVRRRGRGRSVSILPQSQGPDHKRADHQRIDEPVGWSGEGHGLSPSGPRRGSARSTAWPRPEGQRRPPRPREFAGEGRTAAGQRYGRPEAAAPRWRRPTGRCP